MIWNRSNFGLGLGSRCTAMARSELDCVVFLCGVFRGM